MNGTSRVHANSAARAVAIVEFLASRPEQSFSLSEISRRCGLRKSTAYTILGTLHDAGWLIRSPIDLRYSLGPTLIVVGHAAEETRPEINLARPLMIELAEELQRECVLSAAMGNEIIVLESTGPPGLRFPPVHPGQRAPLVAPFGTVFMAWRADPDRRDWYERSGLTDPNRIRELEGILETTVRRGYVVTLRSTTHSQLAQIMSAVSDDLSMEEFQRMVTARLSDLPPVAYLVGEESAEPVTVESFQAPIFDATGAPTYALTVSHIEQVLDRDAVADLGNRVRNVANQVSQAIAARQDQRHMAPPQVQGEAS